MGVWLSPDPAFDGLNLYSYVHNNPVNLIDPTGYNATHSRDNPIQVNVPGVEEGKVFALGVPKDAGNYSGADFDRMTENLPVYQQNSKGLSPDMAAAIGSLSMEGKADDGGFTGAAFDALLVAGAAISMEGGDAIRTDGTGSRLGNPGGNCESCEGSRWTQGAYIALTVGALIGGSAWQGYREIAATRGPNVLVSSWADKGVTPDLNTGRWVMPGLPTRSNFFLSGLWGPKWTPGVGFQLSGGDISNAAVGVVPRARLLMPRGGPLGVESIKGLFGQRVLGP